MNQTKDVIAAVLLTAAMLVAGGLVYSTHASETLIATVIGGVLGYVTHKVTDSQ